MSIYYLDEDPVKAAQAHYDSHLLPKSLEYGLLLSACYRLILPKWVGTNPGLYEASETILEGEECSWARSNLKNMEYLVSLFKAVCEEYTYRTGKQAPSEVLLEVFLKGLERLTLGMNHINEGHKKPTDETVYLANTKIYNSFGMKKAGTVYWFSTEEYEAFTKEQKVDIRKLKKQRKKAQPQARGSSWLNNPLSPSYRKRTMPDSICSNRNFYVNSMIDLRSYTKREEPEWFTEFLNERDREITDDPTPASIEGL